MEMFNIIGFANKGVNGGIAGAVDEHMINIPWMMHLFHSKNLMCVQLNEDFEATNLSAAKQEFKMKYLDHILSKHSGEIYYNVRFETRLGSGIYENVTGYCKIKGYGVYGSYPYNTCYLEIETMDVDNENTLASLQGSKVNPVVYNAWQHMRLNVPEAIWPNPSLPGSLPVTTPTVDMVSLIAGLNNTMLMFGFANRFDDNHSYVRLQNPNRKKLGGGNRVKKISSSDSWASMTSGDNYSYQQ